MTTLADVVVADGDVSGNPEAARNALREAVTATSTEPTAAPAATATDDDGELPEKLRGKSRKEIADMYRNLESVNGRMANDLGTQRQLTDRLLDLKRSEDLQRNTAPSPTPAPKPTPVTANDILDRPQETLERVIEARVSKVVESVDQRLARAEAALAEQRFTARHPDFNSVARSEEFGAWVQASPLRMRAAAAANRGDWILADELLTEFKGSKPATAAPARSTATQTADLEGARKGSLETSGASSGTDGKSRGGQKEYKRADLMRLRIEDPEAYYDEGFQNEILKAHHEGRVK